MIPLNLGLLKLFFVSKQFIAVYGENTGVEYDLLYHVNHHIELQYRWIVGDWSACSATCARGKQFLAFRRLQ